MSKNISNPQPPYWRNMHATELDVVDRIADEIHVGLPERPEVFVDKFEHFPKGCLTLTLGKEIVGYGVSHPWMLNDVPALDTFLGELPLFPDCLFIHDVAVLPLARGHRAGERYVEYVSQLAAGEGISSLALVSVYGTHSMWAKLGFTIVADPKLENKLRSYGEVAHYMIKPLKFRSFN